MTSFASLMALSATQTQERQSAVDVQLAERQRKEELKRKKQEEQDKKDRENAAKMRARHFEELKREEERKQRKEAERKALEAERQRREEEHRNALLYGPKKGKSDGAPKWPSSSSSQHREEARRRKPPSEDDNDDGPRSEPLTREELRERKLQAELRRTFTTAKRSTTTGSYHKPGRRLPGGAVDLTTSGPQVSTGSGSQSVKERLAAMPNTLTKLNTVKRDTRTIDEILQDRAKAREHKTLDGDEALAFNDWFGSGKKKDKSRPGSAAPTSGANTPKSSTPALQGSSGHGSTPTVPGSSKKAAPSRPLNTASSKPIPKSSASRPIARPVERSEKAASSKATSKPKTSNSASSRPSSALPKKRARSLSRSESPYSKKRARSEELDDDDEEEDGERLDVSGLIWGLMGKKRSDYVKMDVFSDDEDMEADARALEREEKMSARLAKREDMEAQEAERRHEEEKKRRRLSSRP